MAPTHWYECQRFYNEREWLGYETFPYSPNNTEQATLARDLAEAETRHSIRAGWQARTVRCELVEENVSAPQGT